ncbi:outer membrane protein assembly factor BamB family protein [Salmonirosea aquatica]|uniref:outer membrane protein assembly factor BamB family protein n=1 Tax=Salmonirosea aquatica TaxID=2654236 RepID=UPI003570C26B
MTLNSMVPKTLRYNTRLYGSRAFFQGVLFLLLLGGLFNCKRPEDKVLKDADGVVTKLPHIWKSSTSLDGAKNTSMFAQHVYNNRFVLAAERAATSNASTAEGLCLKRIEDGRNAWMWNDRFDKTESADVRNYKVYTYQNLLFYKNSFRFYCIDQETGKTVWRKEWGRNFDSQITTTGLGPHFYFTGTPPEIYAKKRWEESIYQGNMATGEVREIAKLKTFPDSVWHDPGGFAWIARGRMIEPFTKELDTLLLVSYDLPDIRPYYQNTPGSGYLSLYNLSKRKWIYERVPLLSDIKLGIESESGGGNYPNIIGNKVYFAVGMWVGCYELMTGKRVWFKRLTPASLFSDMIVAEGKLLANGMNAQLYALDPETGNTLWTQRSSGIGSALHYQDGVVYYIASQDLLATRVSDGKLLWKLLCPDYYTEGKDYTWFMGFVTGIPGQGGQKGKIFASTQLNVYCFEAAQ